MKFAITSLLISIGGFPSVGMMAMGAGYGAGEFLVLGGSLVCLTASLLALESLGRREKRWLSVVALVIALTPVLLVVPNAVNNLILDSHSEWRNQEDSSQAIATPAPPATDIDPNDRIGQTQEPATAASR